MKNRHEQDLSFRHFFRLFLKEFINYDNRFYRTMIDLIMKPGRLTISYLQNEPGTYINPIKIYLIINVVFFIMAPVLNSLDTKIIDYSLSTFREQPFYDHIIQEELKTSIIPESIYEERFNTTIVYNAPTLIAIIIPLFAVLLLLLYWRDDRYYVEHLVFSTHFVSFILIMWAFFPTIITILNRLIWYNLVNILPDSIYIKLVGFFFTVIMLCFAGYVIYYLNQALRHFYHQGVFMSLLKSLTLIVGLVLILYFYQFMLFFYTFYNMKLSS